MPTILAAKKNNIEHFAVPTSAPVMAQPIMLDFSATRKKTGMGLGLVLFLLPALIASMLSAVFLMGQLMGMKRYTAAEPQVSLAMEPLPSQDLAADRDAPANTPEKQLNLVPILETLPLYASEKPRAKAVSLPNAARASVSLEVDPAGDLSHENNLLGEADTAVETGDTEQAIRLYTRLLERNSGDSEVRANLVALWLSAASREDNAGNTGEALAAYDNALRNWRGSRQTEEAIRARMHFLEGKRVKSEKWKVRR